MSLTCTVCKNEIKDTEPYVRISLEVCGNPLSAEGGWLHKDEATEWLPKYLKEPEKYSHKPVKVVAGGGDGPMPQPEAD